MEPKQRMIAIRSAFLGGANTHYLRYARTKAAIRGTIMELVSERRTTSS